MSLKAKHIKVRIPLPHRLFLDHDIIFYFKTTLKKFMKKFNEALNTCENIMKDGALVLIFGNTLYFKDVKRRIEMIGKLEMTQRSTTKHKNSLCQNYTYMYNLQNVLGEN